MFTNPYDAAIAQRDASQTRANQAAKVPWYRQGAVSGSLIGEDLGRNLGGMLGMQTPEEAKQNKIQEIMDKFGEGPKTPEQLLEIADSFRQAGMLDLWQEATDAAEKQSRATAYAKSIDIQNKSLEMKQEEHAANQRKPKLGNWWDINQKQGAISWWLQNNIDNSLFTDKDKEMFNSGKVTHSKAQALIKRIFKGGSGSQNKLLAEHLKNSRNTHIVNNMYNPEALTSTQVAKTRSDDELSTSTKLLNPVPQSTGDMLNNGTTSYVANEDKSKFVENIIAKAHSDVKKGEGFVAGHRGKVVAKQKVKAEEKLKLLKTPEGVDTLVAEIQAEIQGLSTQTLGHRGRFAKRKIEELQDRIAQLLAHKETL